LRLREERAICERKTKWGEQLEAELTTQMHRTLNPNFRAKVHCCR
jgi:hypothetical protein